ncbi:hypothetical protein [Sphingomonas sp.]|uniref:hypothetical protein n=1 Tax=Sphingomonas sp. TaxID=28214 RepID=UPI003B3B7D8B
MGKPAVLYISYDGMLEPLGQSQVIAYLDKLSPCFAFDLVSFEKAHDWRDRVRRKAMAERLRAAGIRWHPLRYHKAPTVPATAYDVARGTALAIAIALRRRTRIVHARSYLPALIGLQVKRLTGAKLLFDMRGFWGDERVDAGLWDASGRIYRQVKALEQRLLLASDAIVTLTHASVAVIRSFPYLAGRSLRLRVIPTCADLDRFAPRPEALPEPLTLGYVGSVGTWYLFDEVLECFRLLQARRPDARLLIVNRDEHGFIRERLAAHGATSSSIELIAAGHGEMPGIIARMSAGAAIIAPFYSKIASAPTKLAEYLGCGIPCLGNVGVGDMAQILEGEAVGAALQDYTPAARSEAVDRLLALLADPATPARCRATAERLFSLEGGAAEYRAAYEELLA